MPVRVQPDLEPPGLGLCLYHYFCLCAATSRVRERGVEWREPLKQTAYYANDSCDAHGWAGTASPSLSRAFLGAPLITEEVARAEGDGRSWRMDATAFEFVYLSFVNSMFLSTFALLCSIRSFGCLFICLSLACVPPFTIPQSHCHCRSHSPALACKHSAANWIRFNLFTAQTKRGEFCLCDAANNNMKPRFMAPTSTSRSTSKDSMDSSIRKRNRFPFAIAWTRFSRFSLSWIYAKTVSIHQMLPAAWSRLFNYKTQWMWNGALTCSMPGSIYPAQLLQ